MKNVYYFCIVVEEQKGFAREHQHGLYETKKWVYTNDALGGDFHREYLLVQISLSEWMHRSVRCTERLRRNAVLYCSPALGQWCGMYATSQSAEVRQVVWPWYTQLSANDAFHVQLVWILTTKRTSLLRVENGKGLNFLLLWLCFYLF